MSFSAQTQALDVPSAIVQRRSIKTFKPDSISPDLLKQLVELTVAAPSSFNVQSWRIVLVQEETQKQAFLFRKEQNHTLNPNYRLLIPFKLN